MDDFDFWIAPLLVTAALSAFITYNLTIRGERKRITQHCEVITHENTDFVVRELVCDGRIIHEALLRDEELK